MVKKYFWVHLDTANVFDNSSHVVGNSCCQNTLQFWWPHLLLNPIPFCQFYCDKWWGIIFDVLSSVEYGLLRYYIEFIHNFGCRIAFEGNALISLLFSRLSLNQHGSINVSCCPCFLHYGCWRIMSQFLSMNMMSWLEMSWTSHESSKMEAHFISTSFHCQLSSTGSSTTWPPETLSWLGDYMWNELIYTERQILVYQSFAAYVVDQLPGGWNVRYKSGFRKQEYIPVRFPFQGWTGNTESCFHTSVGRWVWCSLEALIRLSEAS